MIVVGICVWENSSDTVETRWRDIDGEGGSRSLYLPWLPPSQTQPLFLALERHPNIRWSRRCGFITRRCVGRMSGVVISLQVSNVREILYICFSNSPKAEYILYGSELKETSTCKNESSKLWSHFHQKKADKEGWINFDSSITSNLLSSLRPPPASAPLAISTIKYDPLFSHRNSIIVQWIWNNLFCVFLPLPGPCTVLLFPTLYLDLAEAK